MRTFSQSSFIMNRFLQWKWALLAPFFGALLSFGFAPSALAYLPLLSLGFFYGFCLQPSLKAAVVTGYGFGVGLFTAGIWWAYISIHDFGGADAFSAGLLTALLIAFWSLFPALTAGLMAKCSSSPVAVLRCLLAALAWVGVEVVRGDWVLNGFPWLQVGYSQIATPLAGYVPLLGVYGTGFLLMFSAALLVETGRRQLSVRAAFLLLTLIFGSGQMLSQVQWTQPVGQPVTVTLIQGNIDQKLKWLPNQRQKTLSLYQDLTEQHWDSDVIIWPETSVPAFMGDVKEAFLEPLASKAREHGVDLVISLPVRGEGKTYYNSVLTLGRQEALYHKIHLLPFGEYLPLQPVSGWVMDRLEIPLGSFTAGQEAQPLLQAGGYPFVTTICYEDAFGDQVRRQAGQAAYLVNVTNDGWFGVSEEPYQHMQMAQMRALETGRYLLRATNTGLTGFVKPNGQLVKQAPLLTTTALTDKIIPMTGTTPYMRLGDKGVFSGLIMLLGLAYGLYGRRA